jgi:hypothetical protein
MNRVLMLSDFCRPAKIKYVIFIDEHSRTNSVGGFEG